MVIIQSIIKSLELLSSEEIREVVIVLPSKRALLYFKEAFIKSRSETIFWLPEMLTVDVFYEKCAGLKKTDELLLTTALFSVYEKHWEDASFSDFYSLGKTILQDFNVIDQHLLDASKVYENFERWKEIDDFFDDFTDDWEQFLTALQKDTLLSKNMQKIWGKMFTIYQEFKELLAQKNWAYYGGIIRTAYDKLDNGSDVSLPFSKVYVGGLNTLSHGEKSIWKVLCDRGLAETFWQEDKSFFDYKEMDAGRGLRLLKDDFQRPSDHWLSENMFRGQKEVGFFQSDSHLSAYEHIKQAITNLGDEGRVAIILGDESILNSFVGYFNDLDFNVSIGYSVTTSKVYSLVVTLINFQESISIEDEKLVYNPKVLFELLSILTPYADGKLDTLKSELFKKKNTLALEEIPIDYRQVLLPSESLIRYLIDILTELFYEIKESEEVTFSVIEQECAYLIIKQLHTLDRLLKKTHFLPDNKTIKSFIIRYLKDVKVPFDTDNQSRIQVMGLLETRCLDFEHIFCLGFTEGYLPKPVVMNSYLPYSIRRYFNLPMPEDRESVLAYHFFRLLQKASSLNLYHVRKSVGIETSEVSRYKNQLIYLDGLYGKEWDIEETFVQDDGAIGRIEEVEITKESTEEHKKLVKEKVTTFSASSLSLYLKCQLKFYFEKVLKLKEEDNDTDASLDQKLFGTLVHDTLEYIYKPYEKEPLTVELLNKLVRAESIHAMMQEAVQGNKELELDLSLAKGKIRHQMEVSAELVRKTIESDIKDKPDEIVANELEFSVDIPLSKDHKVRLIGKIDRVDRQNGILRILDYKTGLVKLLSKTYDTIDTYFDDLFVSNVKDTYGYEFQVWVYMYGYYMTYGYEPMQGALIEIKANQVKRYVYGQATIEEQDLILFGERLKTLMESIFLYEKEDKFSQAVTTSCTYCPFKLTCGRKSENY